MKKCLLILSSVFTMAASQAATVGWNATIDTGLIDNTAAALTVGNYVRIGYFATFTDSQVIANSTTTAGLSALNLDFKEFANTTIGTGTVGTPATFAISSTPSYGSLPGFTPNSQIYFWALKSTNVTSLSTALATATATAIAYLPFAVDSDWQFPASDISTAKSLDIKDLSSGSSVFLAGSYIAGSSASLTGIFGPTNHAVQLAAVSSVPEPSSVALCAMAVFSTVSVRRRQRK